jgi:hypothetical protein
MENWNGGPLSAKLCPLKIKTWFSLTAFKLIIDLWHFWKIMLINILQQYPQKKGHDYSIIPRFAVELEIKNLL